MGENIIVKANIRQNKEIKHRFEVNGTKENLNELAKELVKKATEVVAVGN